VVHALLVAAAQGTITSVSQTAYNVYTVLSTGSTPWLVNVDDYRIPECDGNTVTTQCVTRTGNTFTTSGIVPYGVKQTPAATGGPFSRVIQTWNLQLTQATACCREPSWRSNSPTSNYMRYIPTVTVSSNSQLTVTANRVAPMITYVKLGDGTIVSLDAPIGGTWQSEFPGTVSSTASYTRTVSLPSTAMATETSILACGAVSGAEEACRIYTKATNGQWEFTTASTFRPPFPPPTPPSPPPLPPSPPSPPLPPYTAPVTAGNGAVYTRAPSSSGTDGATVALIIFGILLGLLVLGGIFIYLNKSEVLVTTKRQRERSTMVRIPDGQQMTEPPGNVA